MTSEDPDAALRDWLRAYAKDHPRRGSGPLTTTPVVRAGTSITKRFNGFGATKDYVYRSGDGESAAAVRPRRPT